MSHARVKMPNGKWRLWSTVADGWISEPLDEEPSTWGIDFKSARGTLVCHMLLGMAWKATDDDNLALKFANHFHGVFDDFDKCADCDVTCNGWCEECLFEYLVNHITGEED